MNAPRTALPLQVGYAEVEITPRPRTPLSGTIHRHARLSDRIRDPLRAKALHLQSQAGSATLVIADLLVITSELASAVALASDLPADQLLISATHTHSGPGAYWDGGPLVQLFMGPFDPKIFDQLVNALAEAAKNAQKALRPAELSIASTRLAGANANRRQLHGPTDPELSLLRFEPAGEKAIDLLSFGAHPVLGCIAEPQAISADFPGEICRRIEARGRRALFFQGAVGGVSPLYPEHPLELDEHLTLYGDVLERGVERAETALKKEPDPRIQIQRLEAPLHRASCAVFPLSRRRFRIAERATFPFRRWLAHHAERARQTSSADLHLLRIGAAALIGAPCDLGVNVALGMKALLKERRIGHPIPGSHCGGYVGYVHLPRDYQDIPEPGFRQMSFYENAMSLAGHQMGQRWLQTLGSWRP